MKQLSVLLLFCLPIALLSCSKGGGTTPAPVPVVIVPVAEPEISFKVEIDTKEIDYAGYTAALSATQPININVTTSPFPKDGVTVDVSVKKDVDNSTVSASSAVGTIAATNALSITNLTAGVLCTAVVTVTSKTMDPVSKGFKTFQRSFKIARK